MTTSQRRSTVLLVLVAILGLFLWQALVVRYVEDDSFISFRYAQHFAQGQGLVYNLGERVEGYSNFLWVVLLAGASRLLPFASLPALAEIGGLCAAVLTILLVCRFPPSMGQPIAAGLLAALLLAVQSGLVAWSTAGLETTLFACVLFAGAAAFGRYLREGEGIHWIGIWFGLAALTRADGVLFFAATFAFAIGVGMTRASRTGVRPALQLAAAFFALYLPYLLWRYSYYGDLVPNTAYVKAGGGLPAFNRGIRYVWSYVVDYGVWLWLPAVLLYLWRTREAWAWYFVWLIVVNLGYVVYVGGDSLGFHRFIVHVVPLMSVLAGVALVDMYERDIRESARGLRLVIVPIAIALLMIFSARSTAIPVYFPAAARWYEPQSGLSFPGTEHPYRWFNNYFVDRLAVAARYLQTNAPPNSLVAATPAGAIAYYMDHRVIDMLGLTDRHIARTSDIYQDEQWRYGRAGHEKGDGRYVLSRAPDYILMGNVAVLSYPLTDESMAEKLVFKSEHDLWGEPEFHRRYELVSVRLAGSGPFQYFTFYRKKP